MRTSSKNIAVIRSSKRSSPQTLQHLGERAMREAAEFSRRALSRMTAPAPSNWRQVVILLNKAGISFTHLDEPPPGQFRLSSRQPYIEGAGYLYLYGALEYIPKQDRVIMNDSTSNGGGFVGMFAIGTQPGHHYLFDVSVSANVTLETYQGTTVKADNKGHAFFVVTAANDGTASITFFVRDGLYNFHNVVVSKID